MNVLQFSLLHIIISVVFLYHFEELKILNAKLQIEALFHFCHENYYRAIFLFFGRDETTTQCSNSDDIRQSFEIKINVILLATIHHKRTDQDIF